MKNNNLWSNLQSATLRVCIDAVLERPTITHHNYDIMHVMFLFFWLLIGVYMFRNKNNMTGIHSTWNSIIITESTHEKSFFHISESSHLRNLCFYTCCMGESIERWLWIHTILIVIRKKVYIADGCVSAVPGRSVQGVLVCFLMSLRLITSFTWSHTQIHTTTHTLRCVCTLSDTGGAVLHDGCGLLFMFVGAVFQRAGAL